MAAKKSSPRRPSPKAAAAPSARARSRPPRGAGAAKSAHSSKSPKSAHSPKSAKARPARPPRKPTGEHEGPAVPRRGSTGARSTSAKSKAAAKPRVKGGGARRKVSENPEALRLARTLAKVAADKKAEDVLVLDVRARGSLVGYDYLVLASGETERHLEAIAEAMDERTRTAGRRATSTEASSDWVLIDYDDVIAHVFTREKRAVYDLEGFWSDAQRVGLPA